MAAPENYHAATLPDNVGHVFGVSEPVHIDQQRINEFAHCTGDDQWIHVDVERARRESPVGSTIAHGLLVLSLVPVAQYQLGVYPPDARSVLNYGMEKIRFLAPVPAGTSLAIRVELAAVEAKGPGRFLVRCLNTAFNPDAPDRTVMVGESLAMVLA
ncbi:MAG TPA: MaoC family dehydratase [Burkholderiaceae bacterium]|nr:MaoC family dehydratase [Burkholderiaceae bacterium]HQR70816.1 MaoC family dehydratase [Burkholderiaceae bacterium]